MKKISLFLITAFLSVIYSHAQDGTIKGRIYDESNNEPIPFANLVIFGTTTGVTTDIDGNYSLDGIQAGYVRLSASAVGFEPKVTEDFLVTNARVSFVNIAMTPRAYALQEVVVKSSPFTKTEESPLSIQTLQISEIMKAPGGNKDISRVIQVLPGVATSVSYRNDVIVRGGGSSENSFYIDGIEFPNLNHFSTQGASGGPVSIINADFIREVQLYSGAFPADKGRTLSSVLDMKLVDGNAEKLVFRGSVGASDLALTLNGPLSSNTTFLLSYRRSYLQFLFSALGLPFLPTYNDFLSKVKFKLNQKNELTLLTLGSIDKSKLNTGIKNPTESQRYILGYLPVNDQWSYMVGGIYKHYHEQGYTTVALSRNMLSNRAYKYNQNNQDDTLTYDYLSSEAENKLRAEHVSRMGRMRVSYGAGLEIARYTNSTFQTLIREGMPENIDYESTLRVIQWNLFGELSRAFINDRLTLALGLRMDANDYDRQMANLLEQFSPRLSASYAVAEKWALNMNTGRYYQRPSFTSLGYRNGNGSLVNKDNGIRYLSADHYVAGIEFLPAFDARISLEGFFKNYRHYPFSVRDSINLASKGADYGTFGDEEITSTAKGRAFGFELFFQDKSLAGFNILLSFTYVRSEFTDKQGEYVPSSWDNRHILNLTVLRTFLKTWDAGFRWRLTGGQPFTPIDLELSSYRPAWDARGREYPDYDRFNESRLRNFSQLDIRVEKSFYFDKWSLAVYVDIQNAYNFKAETAPQYTNLDENGNPVILDPDNPYDQQHYLLRKISNENGTIVPTIGIMVEI